MNVFELNILNFIQERFRCGFLDIFMPIITSLGNMGIFYILTALVMLMFKKTRKGGAYLAFALAFGFLAGNLILKNAVMRTRPFNMPQAVISDLLIKAPTDFSFPSGHSLVATEGAVTLLCFNKKAGIPALILGILICFSRLYLYVHYPSDVLCGILLGIAVSFCACKTVNILICKFEKNES